MNAFEVVGTYLIRGVQQAVNQINAVSQQANQSSQSLDQLGGQSDQTSSDLHNLGGSADDATNALNDAGGAAGDASNEIADAGDSSRRSGRQVRSLSARLGDLANTAGDAANRVSGFAAAAVGALSGAALGFGAQLGEEAKLIERYSKLLNTTRDEFQELAFGARSAGFDMETFGDAMTDLQRNLAAAETMEGAGPFQDFFDIINGKVDVSIRQFQRLSGPEALQLMVNSMEKASASPRQMSFALDSVGSDLDRLLPLLRSNGAGMQEMAGRARELGTILSGETVEAGLSASTQLRELGEQTDDIANKLGEGFEPVLREMNRLMEDHVTPAVEWLSGKVKELGEAYLELPEPVRDIIAALGGLLIVFGPVLSIVLRFGRVIIGLFRPIATIIGYIVRFGRLLTPAGIIITGIIAIIGLLFDWGEAWDWVAEKAKGAANWISEALGLGKVFNDQQQATPEFGNADASTDGAAARSGSTREGGGNVTLNNPIFNEEGGLNNLLRRYGSGTAGGTA